MSSPCFAQNDVQQSISSLIGRMNQMELKSAEDTTAIQILTETMDRLQGIVFRTNSINDIQSNSRIQIKSEIIYEF